MKPSHFSLLSGASLAVIFSIPVQAANFDYDQLQLIQARPLPFTNSLSLFGDPANNEGYVAFFNFDPNAPDGGHTEISLNSPGNRAPYYASGRHNSPEIGNTATRSATLNGINGFANFFNYLNNNGISFSDLGYSFGVKSGRDFRETWNLGDDQLGQDWLASPTSTIEERIYAANPDAVEHFLSFGTTKILQFGYSPEYVVFDYGATSSNLDDLDILFSNPVSVTKEPGLSPLLDGLADAFLADVNSNGGLVQFVTEDEAAPDASASVNPPYVIANVRYPLSIRIVSVPESSTLIGILSLGVLGLLSALKKAS